MSVDDKKVKEKATEMFRNVAGGYTSGVIDNAAAASKGFNSLPQARAAATIIDKLTAKIMSLLLQGNVQEAEKLAVTLEKSKEDVQRLTGLPVKEAEGGGNIARAFGEGLTGGGGIPARVLGAVASAVGEAVAPTSPLGKFLISVGVPLAAGGVLKATQKAVANRKAVSTADAPPGNVYKLNAGERSGDPSVITETDVVATHPKTAATVKDWTRERNSSVRTDLDRFTKTLTGPKGNDADEGVKAAKAFENYFEGLSSRIKIKSGEQFDEAYSILGDKRFIDVEPLKNSFKTLIEKYDGKLADPISLKKAEQLKGMLNRLNSLEIKPKPIHGMPEWGSPFTTDAVPPKATLREIQNALENYGQAAYGKGGIFTDIGQGSDIGDAKFIRGAWKEIIENAASSLTGSEQKAAKALLRARSIFAAGMEDVSKFKNAPIAKFIERTSLDTTPEKLMDQFRSMTPAERSYYSRILKDSPETVDTIRKAYFDDLIKSGDISGASARGSNYDPVSVIRAMDDRIKKDPKILEFLFPHPETRAEFMGRVADMRKMAETGGVSAQRSQFPNVAGEAVMVGTGRLGYGASARTATGWALDQLSDKEELFNSLFNGGGKKGWGTLGVNAAGDVAASGVGRNRIAEAARTGPDIEGYEDPASGQQQAAATLRETANTPTGETQSELGRKAADALTGVEKDPLDPDNFINEKEELDPLDPDNFVNEAPKGITPELRQRQMMQESGGDPLAISPAGALGISQFMPSTARGMGDFNPFDPEVSQQKQKEMMDRLYRKYGNEADALRAYNWGEGNVDAWKRTGKGMKGQPMPKETEDYVRKILGE